MKTARTCDAWFSLYIPEDFFMRQQNFKKYAKIVEGDDYALW
jgi:hypothetical protein